MYYMIWVKWKICQNYIDIQPRANQCKKKTHIYQLLFSFCYSSWAKYNQNVDNRKIGETWAITGIHSYILMIQQYPLNNKLQIYPDIDHQDTNFMFLWLTWLNVGVSSLILSILTRTVAVAVSGGWPLSTATTVNLTLCSIS